MNKVKVPSALNVPYFFCFIYNFHGVACFISLPLIVWSYGQYERSQQMPKQAMISEKLEARKSNRGRKKGFRFPPPRPPTGDIAKPANQHFVTGVSKATAYRLEKAGRFPKRMKLTDFSVGWLVSDLIAWRESRQPAA